MGAGFLSTTGLGFGTLIERTKFFLSPALDKNRSPRYTPEKTRLAWVVVINFRRRSDKKLEAYSSRMRTQRARLADQRLRRDAVLAPHKPGLASYYGVQKHYSPKHSLWILDLGSLTSLSPKEFWINCFFGELHLSWACGVLVPKVPLHLKLQRNYRLVPLPVHFAEFSENQWVGLLYLRLGLLYLWLDFVTHRRLAWSFLLTVEIWFGHFCLRWKIGLVSFVDGSPPHPEIGFGLFCLRFPHHK